MIFVSAILKVGPDEPSFHFSRPQHTVAISLILLSSLVQGRWRGDCHEKRNGSLHSLLSRKLHCSYYRGVFCGSSCLADYSISRKRRAVE
jgi:hypothetical protein